MKPVTTGTARLGRAEQPREVRARARGSSSAKMTLACVNWSSVTTKSRASTNAAGCVLVEVGGDDERRQPLAEAGGHVERAQRAVAQQVDALQRAAQLGEQRVDLRAHARRPPSDQLRRPPSGAGARSRSKQPLVRRVAALGEPRALEQLIGDALKRRHDAR